MSSHLKEKEEKIQQLLERLIEESARGTPIVVEGKKDVETLKALGVQGKIVSAKTGGKSRLDVISEVEKTEAHEVILLLDFDRRGKEWSKILKERLERARIRPNLKFWKELQGLVSKEVKDIEGLTSYVETLKKKAQNLD